MSTQAPFPQEPAACSTNWYTRLACKLQRLVEPLCEKRSDFALNLYEQNVIAADLRVTNNLVEYQSDQNFTSQQWLDIITSNNLACSEATMQMLQSRLTPWNKQGYGFGKRLALAHHAHAAGALGWRLWLW